MVDIHGMPVRAVLESSHTEASALNMFTVNW